MPKKSQLKPDFQKLFKSFAAKRIAVVGDVMLDKYIFGHVSRISPEAPVPVIDVQSQSVRLGGAANVATNIAALGATAMLFGAVGDDGDALHLREEMQRQGLSPDYLAVEPSRPTTSKMRVIAQNHHIVRIDSETKREITSATEDNLLAMLQAVISETDAIVLEDYNKGVLTKRLIKSVLALAKRHQVPVTVDPKHDNFFDYKHATVFKPNLKEISDAFGRKFSNTDSDALLACELLQKKVKADFILLTRSEQGATVYSKGTATHIPSVALEVADVSGAGDTVIAVLTAGLTAGLSAFEAARLANFAAAIVCAEVGAVAIDAGKLLEYCRAHF
ncbi:MAG: D-glycero-beta-D-manno-heptose-7-phosphate kinase [Rhizobacter sp.]|nr:D-glycero-beta-D-manno-heptose-7-phosphate kinase [Chlorobiales bacterium]